MTDCVEESRVVIIRGSDRELFLRILVKDTGEPFDLTGATEISASFRNEDGTTLTKLLTTLGITVISAEAGKIKVTLTDANTVLLKVGVDQDFEVVIDIGSVRSIVQFKEALNVEAKIF